MMQPRLDLLREALPYIQRFSGKTFVVKLSGKATEDAENLRSLAEELALVHQVGIRVCVVHGGGKQLNELAELMGVEQTIIGGRRVTSDQTLDLAKMIFAGKINTEILGALRGQGVAAVGLSGVDGSMVQAVRRPPREIVNRETGIREQIDFGFVGDVVNINDRLLRVLLREEYLPVVASLGADSEGQIFNINADTIAAEIAVSLAAEKLILLSDVDGVHINQQVNQQVEEAPAAARKISRLTSAEAAAMIRHGAATGGMIPKLESLIKVLQRGVKSAHIINGATRNALLAEVFTDEGTGTMVTADKAEVNGEW